MNNFITNSQETITLKERLQKLISGSYELKFLVGFFYFSGWQEIYNSLEENSNVILKILVGLQIDKYLSDIIEVENKKNNLSNQEHFTQFIKSLGYAINNSEMDNEDFYKQIEFFIKLLQEDRLIIKKTLNPNHAKVYIFKLQPNLFNLKGQIITGSSNLTKAGLHKQEEFNVEIRDYGFDTAENYFDQLWESAIPITEAENGKKLIIDFLKNKTQSSLITPYEAYAYILKTYIDLQEHKKINSFIDRLLEPNCFEKYTYQLDAVNQALNIIETYNGVIIADVVGLGKSVIASLIANQLGKRGLILCPPGLIGDKKENSGWWEYWNKFKLYDWDIESSGNIEAVAESIRKNNLEYQVVIVDEAHKFRNQDTSAYEALTDICRAKQVILLTATPFNNSPSDIFSLLKLFLVPGQSSITIEPDLEGRFNSYNFRFQNLAFILKNYNSHKSDKQQKSEKLYTKMLGLKLPIDISIVKDNVALIANDIRNVITPVIIRRNRLDLKSDFEYKQEIQNLSEVNDPIELFYDLSKEQSAFYDRIIKDYFSEEGQFKGAIYKPFEYEAKIKQKKDEQENRTYQQQRNLFDFMRRLLVKRFESSFGAFNKSIERFLRTHKMVKSFIEISGKYVLDRKVIDSIYNEDDFTLEAIEEALEEFKKNAEAKTSSKHTTIYEIDKFAFKEHFLKDIDNDIALFEEIKRQIETLNLVNDDPKRKAVLKNVKKVLSKENNPKRKIILFTEYTDTVRHLKDYFDKELSARVLFCDGNISKKFAVELDANFNAKYKQQMDAYDVLITSDKLSEGVNLNRAGLIINYDIPWNPTRVIQRVGRINRIGTKVFNELYIHNFFPTEQGANQVKIREIAAQKMFLIHNALGEDAKIFDPDEEPTASGLFKKINSSSDENEDLNIVTIVRNEFNRIKAEHPEVVERITELPNRTKTSKAFGENNTVVLRKKGMALFSVIVNSETNKISEKTFQELFDLVKCSYEQKRLPLSKQFWKAYEKVKQYKPQYKSGSSEIALEKKAINSLKYLLKQNKEELNKTLISFIDTLLKDIKRYKTLPKYTLRKLVLSKYNYKELINNIENLRRKIGSDYLEIILKRTANINDDIIIAVENKK
ncbi:helicase-related protein [Candidatus Marithrix sp. Canyon 246]|uniref:helicase-related protein n=1 Tax=Candidatus Marithrix sp. Canyon 246 TaxID=1827136 RepID=UPI00084A211D|nr:helicase-related protein [Candidatus Marithrix sp. Canyon 246]